MVVLRFDADGHVRTDESRLLPAPATTDGPRP
jgi:hypothetical protein